MDVQGKTVVLTGKFEQFTRKEAQTALEELGATCGKSVTKTTDILFAGARAGSKVSKATRYGIPVHGEDELMALLVGDPDEKATFDAGADDLAAAVAAFDWKEATDADVEALIGVMRARPSAIEDARPAIEALYNAKRAGLTRARLRHNFPHQNQLAAWAMSHDGRYFATGAWVGDDYDAGGDVAIWEVATGDCVNVREYIDGGVGWPDERGCIQWSPNDKRVGLSFATNGVGWFEPFEFGGDVPNYAFVTEGWDTPPKWCWAPDNNRVFISCWGRGSNLCGCIVAPSPHNPSPVPMNSFDEDAVDEELQDLGPVVWTADDVIAGVDRWSTAYAIDATTRELLWHRSVPEGAALSPDGRFIAFCDKRVSLLDTATGDTVDILEAEAGGQLYWSPGAERLAQVREEGIFVWRGSELETHIEVDASGTPDYSTPDLSRFAWHADAERFACLTHDGELQVWRVGESPAMLSNVPVEDVSGVFFGEAVVAAGSERLTFINAATGEVFADHRLFEFPTEDPVPTVLDKFPDGDTWGYASSGYHDHHYVVASHEPDATIQLAIDGRFSVPFEWAGFERFDDLYDAVAAYPDDFPEEVREQYAERPEPGATPVRKAPFPVENEHGVDDVIALLLETRRANRPYSSGEYLGEVAVYLIRHQRYDAAVELLDELVGLGEQYDPGCVAHAACYLARADETDAARPLLDAAAERAGDQVSVWAWIGAGEQLCGDDDQGWLQRAAEADIPSYEQRSFGALAAAQAMLGRWQDAFATIERAGGGMWWHDLAETADLVCEQRDLDLLEDFLKRMSACGQTNLFELLDRVVAACQEAGEPDRAWQLTEYFEGLSVDDARATIAANVFDTEGAEALRKLLAPAIAEAIREGWTTARARLLALWARHDAEAVAPHVESLLEDINLTGMTQQALVSFLASLATILPKIGADKGLQTLFEAAGEHAPWTALLEAITPDHPLWNQALEHARASQNTALIGAVADYPEVFDEVVDELVAAAGRDRYELEGLVKAVADAGDLDRANAIRMRLPQSQRQSLTNALGRAAFENGHLSAGLAMLSQLSPGQGTNGREFEALRALVFPLGDGVPRVSSVM